MKYTILLFCTLCWQSLLPQTLSAQSRFDSVVFEMNDIEVNTNSSVYDPLLGNSSKDGTSISSKKWYANYSTYRTNMDSIIFGVISQQPKNAYETVIIVDSALGLVKSFSYKSTYLEPRSGQGTTVDFSDARIQFNNNGFEIHLDSAGLETAKFQYNNYSSQSGTHGSSYSNTESSSGRFSPTSSLKVSYFQKGYIASAVHNPIENGTIFTMHPNPANRFVDISYPHLKPGSSVTIFDVLGREVLVASIENPNPRINISALAEGIYGVRCGGKIYKLIIQR